MNTQTEQTGTSNEKGRSTDAAKLHPSLQRIVDRFGGFAPERTEFALAKVAECDYHPLVQNWAKWSILSQAAVDIGSSRYGPYSTPACKNQNKILHMFLNASCFAQNQMGVENVSFWKLQAEGRELPEIKAAQEIQKRNPYGSKEHRTAYNTICDLA